MATLREIGELASSELRERVDQLVSAVQDPEAEFGETASLATGIGELADAIAAIYRDLEQTLAHGLQSEPSSERTDQDVTKEELLERARELDVEGRSTMSKDELAEAVESEEAVTKDELLERAREAGIEGRSSMTKEQLREALHDAGA